MIPVRSASFLSLFLGLAACSPSGLPARPVEAVIETASVAGTGDAADDPAIWVSTNPADSLVFGTDKDNGVYVYNMDGSEHAYLPEGRLNNVDVRYGFDLGGRVVDLAGASDRSNIGVAFFFIDPASREVSYAGAVPVGGSSSPTASAFTAVPALTRSTPSFPTRSRALSFSWNWAGMAAPSPLRRSAG